MSRWLSPSPAITLSLLQFDFREGGVYRFAYHVPGGKIMTVRGTYRSIEPPSRIVFSWIIEPPDEHAGLESEVTVTITRDGEVTELLIQHQKLTRSGAGVRHAEGGAARSSSWPYCCWSRQSDRMLADQELAESVRTALAGAKTLREVNMFGGIGFMLNGNLVAAASKRGLLVRVGSERQGDALARAGAGARPMVMRGRTMDGYIYVDPPALTGREVQAWLRLAVGFVQTLPPKEPGAKRVRAKGKGKRK